jgi:hypothetical protein
MNPFQGTQELLRCVPRMRTKSSVAGLALTSSLTEPTQPCVNPRSVDGRNALGKTSSDLGQSPPKYGSTWRRRSVLTEIPTRAGNQIITWPITR